MTKKALSPSFTKLLLSTYYVFCTVLCARHIGQAKHSLCP